MKKPLFGDNRTAPEPELLFCVDLMLVPDE
jgi:hypothetical protein